MKEFAREEGRGQGERNGEHAVVNITREEETSVRDLESEEKARQPRQGTYGDSEDTGRKRGRVEEGNERGEDMTRVQAGGRKGEGRVRRVPART